MKNKIYDFDDFCEAVNSAGKNVNIKKMTIDDFYEWQDYTTQYKITNFPGCYHDLTLVTLLKWKLTEAVSTLGTELVSIMNPLRLAL